jgi:AhpD family alkylhydroperoxidase
MTVSYVEREQASPKALEMYDKAEERFTMLLNIFKTMGHCPNLFLFIMEILQDGEIDWVTKELIILKATHRNDCEYCVVQHETLSKRLGISEDKIADIGGERYKTSPHFTDAERALLDLTVQIGVDANRVPEELWARVHEHFTEPQIVEAVAVITAYIMVSKFGDALGVALEPVFDDVQPILFQKAS